LLLDIAVRIVLLPVLIGQAILVSTRILKLPEPPGERSGIAGAGPAMKLLIIGDSSAAGVGADTQADALLGQLIQALCDNYTVQYDLVALTGARTADALGWLADLPSDRYDVVVTAFGVNDVTKGTSLRQFLARQRQLLDQLQSQQDAGLVVVSGLPPVGDFPALPHPLRWILGRQAARFDVALRQMVDQRAGCFALEFNQDLEASSMSRDGFHPGPAVYAAWAAEAAKCIKAHAPVT
jgi:lysophospholipase L1-like esterase